MCRAPLTCARCITSSRVSTLCLKWAFRSCESRTVSLLQFHHVAISDTCTWGVRWSWPWRCCPGPPVLCRTALPYSGATSSTTRSEALHKYCTQPPAIWKSVRHFLVWMPALMYVVQDIYNIYLGTD